MKQKQNINISATMVERLFLAGIFILIIILIANYSLVSGFLKSQASEVDHARIDLKVSEESVSQTEKMKTFLSNHSDFIKRTDRASGKPINDKSPQEQTLEDLQNYAKLINMQITGYDFQDVSATPAGQSTAATTPTSGSSSSTQTTTTTTTTTTAPTTGKTTTPTGVKELNVTIALSDKMNYFQYLAFLSLLHNGASRMELKDITIESPDSGGQDPATSTESSTNLSIKVYTR